MTLARLIEQPDASERMRQVMLASLHTASLDVTEREPGIWAATPGNDQVELPLREDQLCFSFANASGSQGSLPAALSDNSPLYRWAREQLNQHQGGAAHAAPSDQPTSVHEIASQLLDAYTVDEGHAHLAGCHLDDVPVVHLLYRSAATGNGNAPATLVELFVLFDQDNPQGRALAEDEIESLGLDTLIPASPKVVPSRIATLVDSARNVAADQAISNPPIATTICWCKYAHGTLQFTIGESKETLSFADWARNLTAPPFQSSQGMSAGFHVAATDEGVIVATEDIAACEVSGRRLLASDLIHCPVTRQRVAEELTAECPVSGERILESALAECEQCRQLVSPRCLEKDRCEACRHLSTVRRGDSRLEALLTRFPRLAQWQWYRLGETSRVTILTAAGLFERVLVVADRETLLPLHVAQGNRLSKSWTAVALEEHARILGSSNT